MRPTGNGLVILSAALVVVALELCGASAVAAEVTKPTVGIDTTFGDRYKAAAIAFSAKRWQEAIATTTAALALKPDPKNAAILLNWRGYAHFSVGHFSEALADFSGAIRDDPQSDFAHANRGHLRMLRGEFAEAVNDFNVALGRHPDSALLYDMRGKAYVRLGNRERARADLQRSLAAPLRNASDHAGRAKTFCYLGDYRQAASHYARARSQAKADSEILNQTAWFKATCPDAAFRDGRGAVRDATRACELTAWKDPAIIDTLATAYAEVGDFEQALRLVKQALGMSNLAAKDRPDLQSHLKSFEQRRVWRDVITL
jgi:tetratricopeptide (TPR) repeat protein